MGKEYEKMSNDDLIKETHNLHYKHESVKKEIDNKLKEMDDLENKYQEVLKILNKRLNSG